MTHEEMQKQIESMMPTPQQIVKHIDKELEEKRERILHNILSEYAKDNGLVSKDLEEAAQNWWEKTRLKSDLSGNPINAFKAGAQWQFKIDADLGSPPYLRGFVDGKEHEQKKHRKYKDALKLCKEWFYDIVEKCEHLTSGNVSHNGKMIRGFAKNSAEYIESELKKDEL